MVSATGLGDGDGDAGHATTGAKKQIATTPARTRLRARIGLRFRLCLLNPLIL
jgi:hypothetical protein